MPTALPSPIPHIDRGWQINISGSAFGLPIGNVFYMLGGVLGDAPTATEVGTLWSGAWITFAASVLHDSYETLEIGVYDLSLAESVKVTTTPTAPGGRTGEPSIPGTAALFKHPTEVRKKRGLTYIGAVPVDFLDPVTKDRIKEDSIPTYRDAWNALVDTVTSGSPWGSDGARMCMLSRVTGGVANVRLIPYLTTVFEEPLSSLRKRRLRG